MTVHGNIGEVATRSAAKTIDGELENRHWAENFKSADYADPKLKYADYEPAYRFGWESYSRYEGRDFDSLYVELQREWDMHRADSPLTWEKAKEATRAAWRRVETTHADDATVEPGAPKRKAFETNSTMDRGDEKN